jgi:hypothetical protein
MNIAPALTLDRFSQNTVVSSIPEEKQLFLTEKLRRKSLQAQTFCETVYRDPPGASRSLVVLRECRARLYLR